MTEPTEGDESPLFPRLLNPPAPEGDERLIEQHQDEMMAVYRLTVRIRMQCNLHPDRILVPRSWGWSEMTTSRGALWQMISLQVADVLVPSAVYQP